MNKCPVGYTMSNGVCQEKKKHTKSKPRKKVRSALINQKPKNIISTATGPGRDMCTHHSQCGEPGNGYFCHSGWNGTEYGPRYCQEYHGSAHDGHYPMGKGDGDCDSDDHCAPGLICDNSYNNCGEAFYKATGNDGGADCCQHAPFKGTCACECPFFGEGGESSGNPDDWQDFIQPYDISLSPGTCWWDFSWPGQDPDNLTSNNQCNDGYWPKMSQVWSQSPDCDCECVGPSNFSGGSHARAWTCHSNWSWIPGSDYDCSCLCSKGQYENNIGNCWGNHAGPADGSSDSLNLHTFECGPATQSHNYCDCMCENWCQDQDPSPFTGGGVEAPPKPKKAGGLMKETRDTRTTGGWCVDINGGISNSHGGHYHLHNGYQQLNGCETWHYPVANGVDDCNCTYSEDTKLRWAQCWYNTNIGGYTNHWRCMCDCNNGPENQGSHTNHLQGEPGLNLNGDPWSSYWICGDGNSHENITPEDNTNCIAECQHWCDTQPGQGGGVPEPPPKPIGQIGAPYKQGGLVNTKKNKKRYSGRR